MEELQTLHRDFVWNGGNGKHTTLIENFNQGDLKVGVNLYNIAGATPLFSITTPLFLLNKAEVNYVLHQ